MRQLCTALLLLPILVSEVHAADSRLHAANDWVYVLQPSGAASVAQIAASGFDLAVIDYSSDGGPDGELTPAQVANLKASGKVVLAYLSIGEAETYRYYWQPTWNDDPVPDPDAPSWLGPFNPSFPDNYKVRYWQPAWQALLFGTATGPNRSYLDRIVDQGFDGIYLDIIDAFTFWSDEQGERSRLQARQDMVALVQALAGYARSTRGVSGFLIVPQNGDDIVLDDDGELDALGQSYLATIDGIGVEDVFYDELTTQPPAEVTFRTETLTHYRHAGRRILSVDYVWNPSAPTGAANVDRFNDYQLRALTEGYIPYAAVRDRDLNEILTIASGGGLVYCQPKQGTAGVFADGFETGSTGAWSGASGAGAAMRTSRLPSPRAACGSSALPTR